MSATQTSLAMFSEDTPTWQFNVTDNNGSAVDLTGAAIVLILRRDEVTGPIVTTKTVGSGITIPTQTGADLGVFRATLAAIDTTDISGTLYMESRVTLSGVSLAVVYGNVAVSPTGI